MTQNLPQTLPKPDLYATLAALDTPQAVEAFMRDLCTPGELEDFKERLFIATLLNRDEYSYRDIADMTGASTTTVARVARFLKNEPYGGYRMVLGAALNKPLSRKSGVR